ncbi:hypothetical protein VNI00_012873 [Paramarasmius palmivorus]|uniref:Uncharacterized protein n=1 Tax=Paramarasmius palmivorus TaxID=297713 RepID=A0AAW0C3Q0_9AGAR
MPSNSNLGHYDQSLLSDAPAVTKQMRQEGYNPDILAAQQKPATISKENLTSARESPIERPAPTRAPFWRTTKGIIAIVVLVLEGSSELVNGTDTTAQAPGGGAETGNPGGNVGSSAAPTSTSGGGQEVGQSSGANQPVSSTSSSQGAQNSQTTGDQTSQAGTGGQTEGTGNNNGGNVNRDFGAGNIAERIAGGALGGR